MAIKFYRLKDKYGCFSNFSTHAFKLDERQWPTSEHYFQAQKHVGTPWYYEVANASSAHIAADLGRDRSHPLRSNWEDIKDDVMLKCVREKVMQYPHIKELLLSTGTQDIIEDSPIDYYWGCGKDGSGKNMLGKILMKVREEIKEDNALF